MLEGGTISGGSGVIVADLLPLFIRFHHPSIHPSAILILPNPPPTEPCHLTPPESGCSRCFDLLDGADLNVPYQNRQSRKK
jgi:hypothetical protein